MSREQYRLFSPGTIGPVALSNRFVRAATWDPAVIFTRAMNDETLEIYRRSAAGGVGMILTGDFPVLPDGILDGENPAKFPYTYDRIRIQGLDQLPAIVHQTAPACKIIAQLSPGDLAAVPSAISSPYRAEALPILATREIEIIAHCFAETIYWMREEGFDGVELHAAHGGFLSQMLSPYTNHRKDCYGGSLENRTRILYQIMQVARQRVGNYPILIKVNGTDYVPGGIDLAAFPSLAAEIAQAGFDAIEISGGMWDCLVLPEDQLGFRPVPSPEAHTHINNPARQSYFLPYARAIDLPIPVLLTGGNRNVERLEQILQEGKVDFIALSRPLICEPDLPRRWLEGRGSAKAACTSCNSCLYEMYVHPGRELPVPVRCVYQQDRSLHRKAQRWLTNWVADNRAGPDPEPLR